ncbi:hypothetical protein ABH922_000547 [Rhodococcus sp. 27YEA15]|uniref:DUF6928 family protein n=1 Tax=Rhodococcus sp. 27YEA15 TaxID=3156259 RepID=UPI003C7B5E94
MAARVSTIWFVDVADPREALSRYPQPDQNAAHDLAANLYPDKEFESLGPHPLSIAATVQPGYVFIGAYDGIHVVCSSELSTFLPSTVPPSWLGCRGSRTTMFVTSIPETAQGSFGFWENGELRRAFAATPVDIVEDTGIPQTWELPYWASRHPLRYPPGVLPDPQSLPFHPQQFAEAANLDWLGFRYTGRSRRNELDTTQILLWGFKIHRAGEGPKSVPVEPEPVPAATPDSTPRPDPPREVHLPPTAGESAPHAADGSAPPAADGNPPRRRGRLARYFGLK